MSNMQDVPLADPEEGIAGSVASSTATPKSSSLKRFFKLSKKPHNLQDELQDMTESAVRQKDPSKNNTVGRFFTRFKHAHKDGSEEPSSSTSNEATDAGEEHELEQSQRKNKPSPNMKPTIKESISGYWKQLFNRNKAQKQDGIAGMSDGVEEVHELQQVKQDQSQLDEMSEGQDDRKEEAETPDVNQEQLPAVVGLTLQELQNEYEKH
ncbi:uncharacterized protein LOC117586455 isoform X1 [Drosophila guanche]|uniref:Uncharacterized protein n=1 Tax=Drosophila guanche TaxID=7266 RepID=A0A3B0JNG6_DROGU|nr:uncharacterized protein LOC117586455 isoform X1 [Drosophila guanche]SPP83774.1 Hypothetical predicted protein [Drosophila guanche]